MNLKAGDIVVIVSCPLVEPLNHSWHFYYKEKKAQNRMYQLDAFEAELINAGDETAIGDNFTCINYSSENLRLATYEEQELFYKGWTHTMGAIVEDLRKEIAAQED